MDRIRIFQSLSWLLILILIPAYPAGTLYSPRNTLSNSAGGLTATGNAAQDSSTENSSAIDKDRENDAASTKAINLDAWNDVADIIKPLAQKQVVFIGEVHTRLDHHLNQLTIIRGLYRVHPDMAVGVEYFQQPYQKYLDQYVAGEIDETDLLIKTQYYRRWGYDFRLYAPIFRFVREHKIPLIALNVPTETIDQVGKVGISGLSKAQRAALPKRIDESDAGYRKRLAQLYQEHPNPKGTDFDRFYEVQLTWDEGMAASAARYLVQHPGRPMVILSGSGHLAYGSGIPQRLARRAQISSAIVLNDWRGAVRPRLADYLLYSSEQDLPRSGKLGVYLSDPEGPGAQVDSMAVDSAAEAAGIKAGDRIVAVNEGAVDDAADAKARLWNMKPGDRVSVTVRRSTLQSGDKDLRFTVTLR